MIRNQLYPYIEQYINEYLYGFTKEQMELAITQGKLELNKIVIRPDKINSIMDSSNVAFWVKAGIINRIYLGISLMNIIGETPLEVNIDGINMVLSPSYKWINKNLNKNTANAYTKKNPVGLNLDTKEDLEIDFDASIFNKTLLEEVFKDKTLISGIVNSLFKSLYDFYKMPNFAVILKINNINIRIEDDELFNYDGNFSLSIKMKSITMKMGFKGDTKKNSLKIENFAVIWDASPNLLITNKILNDEIKKGKMDDSYYKKVKELDFTLIKDITINDNIKYIIDNFNMTINFGTINSEAPNKDIFKVEEQFKKCYFQISSNELIINLYPEFLNYVNHFSSFNSNFSVIEKIRNHRPNNKPSDENVDKKISTRNWLHYFVWAHKVQNKKTGLHENPIRAEFNRYYNIYHKKVDAIKLLKIINERKNKANQDKDTTTGNEINENNNNNTPPKTPSGDDEMYNLEEYAFINNLDKNSLKAKKEYEKYKDDIIKKKYSNFSSIIEVLIKGVVINMHPSINRNVDIKNSIIVNFSGVELKINLSPEQFNFNLGLGSVDIGPSDRILTERVILCPTSYRQNISNKDKDNIRPNDNLIITPGNDSDINSANDTEKREAGLTGLMKKYNPNYEQKIKIIDEAISKVDETPFFNISNSPSKMTKKNYLLRGQRNTNNYFLTGGIKKTFDSEIADGQDNYFINKPRNTSFTKNMINSFTETDMNLKNKIKKQKNEIKISNAINNYNSNNLQKTILNLRYKNVDNNILEKSFASMNLRFSNKFVYTSNKNYYKENSVSSDKSNKTPHNLLEIYSNSKIGALKLKYTKYNNSFSLDDFSIQVGTIRFNSFFQYFIDMITIVKDYQKSNNKPQIKNSYVHSMDGGGMEGNKILLKMREGFIKTLSLLEGKNKNETIKKYIEYLKNENNKLLTFDTDIDTKPFFELNYLFSYFPKGIKFYFDYENIEGVYYNKMIKMMGKFMISPYNINVCISLSKIVINIFGITFEINNLKESKLLIEKLMEQCSKMLADKKDMVEIIIEPCYTALKAELMNENILDDSIINNIKNIK